MRGRKNPDNITPKASRILNGIAVVLILILIRIWHLTVVQHEEKVEASHKPQRRTIIEKAPRAPILDRFGLPLAINKVQYNVSVSYGGIREIPRSCWQVNQEGKKIKCLKRKEYIEKFSKMLGKELGIESQKIEDLIHAKAAGFGNVPVVIKENISEKTYLKLKSREKDYPGLIAEQVLRRYYPQGRIGSDVVGYVGAISQEEYRAITDEMNLLQNTLNSWEEGNDPELPKGYYRIEEVGYRLKELEAKAYRITDQFGKAGAEKAFEEGLRGSCGFKTYLADTRGNFLQDLESIPKKSGKQLTLTISKELQEYAERLLAEYEKAPLPKSALHFSDKQPWIKGGAAVAMCPKTGQIYALASYPRFDPNDFIKYSSSDENGSRVERAAHWLENEEYLASVWNKKVPLLRERFDVQKGSFYEEELFLTLPVYLDIVLAKNSAIYKSLHKIETIQNALTLKKETEKLLDLFATDKFILTAAKIFDFLFSSENDVLQGVTLTLPERDFLEMRRLEKQTQVQEQKEKLHSFFAGLSLNYEKLLFVDLARLFLGSEQFLEELIPILGNESVYEYRECTAEKVELQKALQKALKHAFHQNDFFAWREQHGKEYLLKIREQEEREKKRSRPYLDYLEEKEKSLFAELWEREGTKILCAVLKNDPALLSSSTKKYFATLLNVAALCPHEKLKNSAENMEVLHLFHYIKTMTSYEELKSPLLGTYPGLRQHGGKQTLKSLAAAFYPRSGFGHARSYAFRQAASVGSIFKLIPAYESLRQRYASLEKEHPSYSELNPLTIIDDKRKVGKEWRVGFTKENKVIPRYYHGGLLPRSEHAGIGEVDLIQALAASSNPYFALLAGEVIDDPEDLCRAAHLFSYGEKTGIELPGEIKGNIPHDVIYNRTGLYSFSIGQHSLVGTPLQTAVMLGALANGGTVLQPKVFLHSKSVERRHISLPDPVREVLLKGLKEVIMGEKGTGRILRQQFPKELLTHVVGKTSTAESMERLSLDATTGKLIVNHVSFGAIYFDKVLDGKYLDPSLVVVVYLRFGEYGKTVAPYAAKLIQKWLEIRNKSPSSFPLVSSS